MKNLDINTLKNKEVFKVPEDYFDTLAEKVMSKIPDDDNNVISINQGRESSSWRKWSSIAASIVLVAVGSFTLLRNQSLTNPTQDITTEQLASTYLSDEDSEDDMLVYSMLEVTDVYNYLAGDEY